MEVYYPPLILPHHFHPQIQFSHHTQHNNQQFNSILTQHTTHNLISHIQTHPLIYNFHSLVLFLDSIIIIIFSD
ncbi:hypothetical protein QVD17_15330 [Tagetes erecta]|uniref:Uncharacterized protein n=1 Tax=Tagetes erecta TaxID=13708 RepID=A0AAD8KS64_TARER|nr:hypothetical protein QVD17_15330 [Tagetes erecta]